MIRKGKYSDIDKILEITKSCAIHLTAQDIFQWNEHYPNKSAFEHDVLRKELYVLEGNSSIIGTIVLSTLMDSEYIPIIWLTENKNNLYIHRLAIKPEHQGKGYAQHLMDFAETFAKENHYDSIRLDTFSQNSRNLKFYENRGYRRLDSIYFPKQSKYPFYCYEFIL
jgi:ribosomal protein S18 acetylase RimI-like enzyme